MERTLAEHAALLKKKEAEWAGTNARFEKTIADEAAEKDLISSQLVAKIREAKRERDRAENAESMIPVLETKCEVLINVNGNLEKKIVRVEDALSEEKNQIRDLWDQLHLLGNHGEYLKEKLMAERLARKIQKQQNKQLKVDLAEARDVIDARDKRIADLEAQVAGLEHDLSDHIALLKMKEQEWSDAKAVLIALHNGNVQDLEGLITQEKAEKETISQQLVSKIRQHKHERERAESAQSSLAERDEEVRVLTAIKAQNDAWIAELEQALAEEKATCERLRSDLAKEIAEKEDFIARFNAEVARREGEEVKVATLRSELAASEDLVGRLTAEMARLEALLADTIAKFEATVAEQEALLAWKTAEWASEKAGMEADHDAEREMLERKLAHAKREKETVSMQLVSKIRQLRQETARSELAESSLAERDEQLAVMTQRYDATAAELQVTSAELDLTKKRLAKMIMALDEERRTASELRVTNRSTEERAERAEKLSRGLAARVADLEKELSECYHQIRDLKANVARLESELAELQAEFEAYRVEAARLAAIEKAKLDEANAELNKMKNILEEKDDQGRTLLERLAASEERERMDKMRHAILQKQYTAMVATFSDKALMNTPATTPPDSPTGSRRSSPSRSSSRAGGYKE